MKEKAAIGKMAANRLRDNQSVIFDSSSTVYEAFDVNDKFEIIVAHPIAPSIHRCLAEKGANITIAENEDGSSAG